MALFLILFHIKQGKELESGDAEDHALELMCENTESVYEKENFVGKLC